jgi:bicarbonate transport system ATP-binding protein
MYSNRENPSHKPLDNYIPDDSVKTIELSPALKNASIAALVAVLAITGVSSLIVGANTTTAGDTEETEEMASGNTTTSAPPENMEATTAPTSESPTTTASPQAMAPKVKNIVEPISDPGKLADLNRQLYNTVNNAWRVTPVTADSRYRVRVTENGEIVDYEPTNQAAASNTNNTPLPDLVVANSPAAGESPTVPYAEFEVIFKADNSLEVNTR